MRKLSSIILMLAFLVVSATGVQLANVPKDKSPIVPQPKLVIPSDGQATDNREIPFYPKKVHEIAGYLFIGAGLVHIGLNRKPLLAYIKLNK